MKHYNPELENKTLEVLDTLLFWAPNRKKTLSMG